jgi:serine/threonine-protein kinase RsbW
MSHFAEGTRAPARLDSLYPLIDMVASFARRQGALETRILEIELVTEELLVNIINHAYPDQPGDVEIVCRLDEAGRLLVEFADEGIPFNMLAMKDPDIEAGIEQRKIGGLGVFFVKQLVQEIRYRREGGKNILTLMIDPAPASL